MGLAAPRHVGSSRTRDRTHVSCTVWKIANYQTTRKAQGHLFLKDTLGLCKEHGFGSLYIYEFKILALPFPSCVTSIKKVVKPEFTHLAH